MVYIFIFNPGMVMWERKIKNDGNEPNYFYP